MFGKFTKISKFTKKSKFTDNSKITIFGDVTKKGNFVIYILTITLFALPFMVSLPCMVITTFTNYGKITTNGLFRTVKVFNPCLFVFLPPA